MSTGKPKLLDLCCKAGGASVGYWQAGFEVTGVDIEPQPHYPFTFVQHDALTLDVSFLRQFDAIHMSPDCRGYSDTKNMHSNVYPRQTPEFRELAASYGGPYIIENVESSPLIGIKLCGQMFGLVTAAGKVLRRHRIFESNVFLFSPGKCFHKRDGSPSVVATVAGHMFNQMTGKELMGMSWEVTNDELAKAIPPAYTEFVGRQLIQFVRG